MKPYIFITNDDGVSAPGIACLIKLMSNIGEVVVVAPDGARSGMSNAITVQQPLRYTQVSQSKDCTIYSCTGTPTDCVKLGLDQIVTRQPDLLVSGINHGSNAAINVIYSGTMGAALEGAEKGIPSIGFSLCDHSSGADFSYFEPYIMQICQEMLRKKLPRSTCLNVNAPIGKIKGIKVVRQCAGKWIKEFEARKDTYERPYFWVTGEFLNTESEATDTDEWALANGYVSVVPTKTDMTAYEELDNLQEWDWDKS